MKRLLVLYLATSAVYAFPPPFSAQERSDTKNYPNAKILHQFNDNIGLGNYKFSFQSSDGIAREETAELQAKGSKNPFLVVHGSYSYIGSDGLTYTIKYVADENGYRPSGQHIPGSP